MKIWLIRVFLMIFLGILLTFATIFPENRANQHFEIPKDGPTYTK